MGDSWEPLTDEEILAITDIDDDESDNVGADVEPVDWENISFESGDAWYVDPHTFSDSINPKMFHDGLPHGGPLIAVDERLPAELNHIEDQDRVLDISKQLGYSDAHDMELVVEVVMNDLSTIYVPFRSTSGTYRHEYLSFLSRQVPKLKKWLATLRNCNVSEIHTKFDKLVAEYNEEHEKFIESIGGYDDVKHGIEHLNKQENKEPEVKSLSIDSGSSSSDADFTSDDAGSTDEEDEDNYDWMDDW